MTICKPNSRSLRSVLFFLFVHSFINSNNLKQAFSKVNVTTFKGIKSLVLLITRSKKITFQNFKKRVTTHKQSGVILLTIYAPLQTKLTQYKHAVTNTVWMPELRSMFVVKWYNKVHNTVIGVSKNSIMLYLRAARHFNKGRYSRNRQLYRTGVYWCI